MSNFQHNIDKFSSFVFRHRLYVMPVILVVISVITIGATKIKTEVILEHLFPYDHPYLKIHGRFAEVFGGGGFGMVIAVKAKEGDIFTTKTLTKVKKITDEILLMDEVYRSLTMSFATNSTKVVKTKSKGEIVIEALMFPSVPENKEEMELLKTNIFSNPSYNGTLVSEDGTAALILTQIKDNIPYDRVFDVFQNVRSEYTDKETSIHIVVYPMLMGWIYSHKAQMYMVFGVSVALIVFILFAVFRNIVGMITPFAMLAVCTGLGLGFIGWAGINFSPLLYVLAFLVSARVLSNAVQITNRYLFEYQAYAECENPQLAAGYNTMRTMLMPNGTAVITDVAGFLVLGVAKIVLMQQVAIMMSFWMLTIALSGIIVPLICSYLPYRGAIAPSSGDKNSLLERCLVSTASFSIGFGKYIVGAIAISILLLGSWQTSKLKVGDPTPGSPILWPDHTYNQDQNIINNKFNASSETFMLFYEGGPKSVYDPIVPKTFEAFSRHMAETLPDIYKSSSSIVDFGKMLNLTYHDGDEIWYQMPRNKEWLTNLLGFINQNVDRGTLRRFMDGKQERAQITLFFSDHTSENMSRIRKAAYDFFKTNPMKTERGEFILAGGAIGLEIAFHEEMKRAHALMDSFVFVAIFFMCSIAFRSFVAGAMLAFPLALSNLVAFIYMAQACIGLSTNTLPCSAVGVGVGVDFSIYLYSRFMEEFPRHKNWRDTIMTSVKTAGKGVFFTGITLILPLIIWYFISALKFQAQMGFFLSLLLFVNLIAALTLHPLLIWMIKPRFMTKQMAREECFWSRTQVANTLST